MIRLLVANGCSFTRGAELANPETESWSAVLAAELGVSHINLARDGASNRRIVRTTVAALGPLCEVMSLRPDEILVVILWTYTARHEYYAPPQQGRLFFQKRRDHGGWEDINHWLMDAGHRASRAFYDHLWSDEGQLTNLFLDWLLLDRYLRHEGYHASYAYASPEMLDIPESAAWFVKQLPLEATFGGVPPAHEKCFTELVRDRGRAPGGHPLADSHAFFARQLREWLGLKGIKAGVPAGPDS